MADLVSTLETAAYCLHTVQGSLRAKADRAGVSTVALTGIDQIASWADEELPGLRRRLNLAIAADDQRPQGLRGGLVQIEEPTMTIAQAQALGVELAGLLRDLGPDTGEPGLQEVEQLEECVRLLREHAGDPDVMASLFGELGAQGVVDLPSQLRRLADACALDGAGWLDADGEPVDTSLLRGHVAGLQQAFWRPSAPGWPSRPGPRRSGTPTPVSLKVWLTRRRRVRTGEVGVWRRSFGSVSTTPSSSLMWARACTRGRGTPLGVVDPAPRPRRHGLAARYERPGPALRPVRRVVRGHVPQPARGGGLLRPRRWCGPG